MIEDEPRDVDREWPVALVPGAALKQLDRLVQEGRLSEEVAQHVWDMLVAPHYARQRLFAEWDRNRRCIRCQVMHPAHKDYERFPHRQAHHMYCPKYMGPLEHKVEGSDHTFLGDLRHRCSCGQSYLAYTEDGNDLQECPDAALDWRGPRPVQ